ncbi:benzoate 4-monooxygenase cytochrome P450 [Penicillium angulare]|uniref:Benzoate 4-monooxygenase cytochrome P450 n=1 Tax=Penicillium angulare TaxID=116970 RepID=A0A9W9FC15_9EURO|nr:benzoate 4-monooxygenase cytochrome P450 [Penicillium angulare]
MDFHNPKHLVAAIQKIRAHFIENSYSAPLSVKQEETIRNDPPIGPLWVSKFSVPESTDDTSRDALLRLIDEANVHKIPYDRPDSVPLDLEWVGYRSNVDKDTPESSISEGENQNTPPCYYKLVGKLAQGTGANVLMVRQRLAPQHPFPAALLDVLHAYLTLINPPPGSPHEAVSPSSIVFAGDSSGGCLALSLLQVILQLQRQEANVKFHGTTLKFSSRSPMVPAGIALLSPVPDLAGAFPSFERNSHCDIYPTPVEKLPYLERRFPTDHIWPAKPPRANFYCEAGMLAHPLVSTAVADDWSGSCPMWIGMGQEQAQDCSRMVAQEAHRAGVSVTLREYECMLHAFFAVFPGAPQSKQIYEKWMQAIVQFGKGEQPPSSACFVRARGLKEETLDPDSLIDLNLEEARKMTWERTHAYKVPSYHQEGGRSNL